MRRLSSLILIILASSAMLPGQQKQAASQSEVSVNIHILDTLDIKLPSFLHYGDIPRPLRLSGGYRVSRDRYNQMLNKDLVGSLEGTEFFLQFILRFGLGAEFFLGGPDYTIQRYEYQFEYGYLGSVLQYHLFHGQMISPYIGLGSVSFKESIGYVSPPITNIGGVSIKNIGCDLFANKFLSAHIDIKRYGLPSYTYPDQVDRYGWGRLNRPASIVVKKRTVLSVGVCLNANFWKRKK